MYIHIYIILYCTYQLYPYLTCAHVHVYAYYTLIAVSNTLHAVYDADGDDVRCKKAVGTECGCVCDVFSLADLSIQVGVVISSPVLLKQLIFIDFAKKRLATRAPYCYEKH